ncbi:MAG: ABC transporter permease [Phycisphaeraceae bacterium]
MKRSHPILIAVVGLSLALLYLPLLAVAMFSVNAAKIGLKWEGFSLKWFGELFSNEHILTRAGNTLLLAVVSTAIATVLGVMIALGMQRGLWRKGSRRMLDTVLDLPVISPDILFAAALVVAFKVWRLIAPASELYGLGAMVIGHVTFQISFVTLVVRSRLVTMGRTLSEAAYDLNASRGYVLRKVTLPLLMPAIVAGAMLAFTLSLDDFVISFFTTSPKSETLPIYIYSSLRRGLSPQVHALSTLIVLANVILIVVIERLTRSSHATAE